MRLSLKSGLVVGFLLGAVSAFLYAPKTGKELREELREKIDAVPYHFFNLMESVVDLSLSVLDFAKESFGEHSYKFSKAVESGIAACKEKSKEMKDLASNVVKQS